MEGVQEEVVYLKVFDKQKGDIVFEGKVSTDVEPGEFLKLRCFLERCLDAICNKATNEEVTSFKGLPDNFELVAGDGGRYHFFSGVLYIGAGDGVLRKSKSGPSCECVLMSVWNLSHDGCENIFECESLEELDIYYCKLRKIPKDIGKMKKLKKLSIGGLEEVKSISEEIGELSNLKELWIGYCGVESLPKRLRMLKSISLLGLPKLQHNAEDLVVFSKLKRLTILYCSNVLTPPFSQSFWEMIKSTTDLRVLELDWEKHDEEMVVTALEKNGSIVDGGMYGELYAQFFKRNKENHERAMACALHLLVIRRWRYALNGIPKEMMKMLAAMLWNTKCDVAAWRISDTQTMKKIRSDE